ncbi:hypothetical protein KJ972_03540 [Candidatus Micrarchaeota archaeon]|nr:hypothetical protein [Candidatus Micrarchaeota archaeon]
MKIGVIAETETPQTKKLVDALNQQKATGIFQSIAEIGLGVKNNKPFLVGAQDFF